MDSRQAVVAAYASLLVVFVLFVLGASHPEWWENVGFVYRFQTLIGAGVAVVAALIGGGAVYHQTLSNRARNRQQDLVKERATRAILPHILSRIMDYVEGCISTLNFIRNSTYDGHVRKGIAFPAAPELPFELMERLAVATETAGVPAQDAMSGLILNLQLQSARLTMYSEAVRPGSQSSLLVLVTNIDTVALDTAAIYARAERLYPYARGQSEEAPSKLFNRDVVDALSKLSYDGTWQNFSFDLNEEWLDRAR